MNKLSSIENEYGIVLPAIYKDFYEQCSFAIPGNLIGTDLLNHHAYALLKKWADELLEECGVANFLTKEDVIFMMHQGYMFWYFKATGDTDPIVYGYYEGRLQPDKLGRFSHFINDFRQ